MSMDFGYAVSVIEDLAACYTGEFNSYIWYAVELGYMTNDEWLELVRDWPRTKEYHEFRGMMAMFVLLAMGEEL